MKPINVTVPFLPPLEEYIEYLKGIWERNWLTNQGPLVQELEQKLRAYHQTELPLHCLANGGLGLQIALKALGVGGEVITTPFSYVATASCPLWEGCSLRFADIEPDHLTIHPEAVEAAITPKTEAIVATHIFGNPCDVETLDAIAAKHGLAMIYDAAHAFGVRYKGKSILEYGDVSMVSLHATKLFHTVEGGFVVAKNPAVAARIEWMRRFGHKGQDEFHGVGINAKMNELHAAMGLCNLKYLDCILAKRKACTEAYDKALFQDSNFELKALISGFHYREGASRNYSYYPVLFERKNELLDTLIKMQNSQVLARRYFYPSLDVASLGLASGEAIISRQVAEKILCLPLSSDMTVESFQRVLSCLHTKQ